MRFIGKVPPELRMAARTRSLASCDGGIRQPDDDELGQAGQDIHLHLDDSAVQPDDSAADYFS